MKEESHTYPLLSEFITRSRLPWYWMATVVATVLLLLVLILVLLAASCRPTPEVVEPSDVTHRQLAEYWSPVWWQDTDEDDFRADYVTSFDFDGDWNPLNNWDNQPQFELKANFYYWVVETTTHWFVGYAGFHPRDWSDDITAPWDQHENDMEGCLLVIQKGGGDYGQFVLMVTRSHENFYSLKDYDSPLSYRVVEGNKRIDGGVAFEENHPLLFIMAEGHAVRGNMRWHLNDFPGGDGVVYRYKGQAEEPRGGNDRDVGYELTPIDELWSRRHDSTIFYAFGTFRGDDHGENKANAPWGWVDKDDVEVAAGDFFLDPAYLVDYYHDGLGEFSHDYIVRFED